MNLNTLNCSSIDTSLETCDERETLQEPRASILVVDDESDNYDVIEAFLSNENYLLHYVSNGYDAIAALDMFNPDVILLDVMMPEINGIEVCKQIQSIEKWKAVPIIMVTALQRKEDLKRCLDAGASDFISKPLHGLELRARVKSMLRIKQQYDSLAAVQKRQAELEAETITLLASRNADLEKKVSERTIQLKARADLMRHNSLHDPLTDLPNRTFFLEHMEALIAEGCERNDFQYAVLFIDLDWFKVINDSLGHLVGDQLLKQVAQNLKNSVGSTHFIARFSGDEFVILIENISSQEQVTQLAQRLISACQTPYTYQDYELIINMSIGIVFGGPEYLDAMALLRDVDIAMYRAKHEGRARYKVFDREMHTQAIKRLELETELYHVIERQELSLFYQPIIDIGKDQLVGFEALVRWIHPQKGFISPVDFIPIAEDTGVIVALDNWVFETACQQFARWKSEYHLPNTFRISINLSVQDLRQAKLIQRIDQVLERSGLTGDSINLEITESIIIEDIDWVTQVLTDLRSRNIQVSIDDFGTGYSSLNYLHRLPVDHLKIDRSFVGQMQADTRNAQVVKTIMSLSQNLGMKTVAEGIETDAQLKMLRTWGCELGQGYYFSKPLSANETAQKWLIS